jgi:hypothetical protein
MTPERFCGGARSTPDTRPGRPVCGGPQRQSRATRRIRLGARFGHGSTRACGSGDRRALRRPPHVSHGVQHRQDTRRSLIDILGYPNSTGPGGEQWLGDNTGSLAVSALHKRRSRECPESQDRHLLPRMSAAVRGSPPGIRSAPGVFSRIVLRWPSTHHGRRLCAPGCPSSALVRKQIDTGTGTTVCKRGRVHWTRGQHGTGRSQIRLIWRSPSYLYPVVVH